jgi:elongation factor Ts
MAEITASLVKELREKSGAGMMDSKKALVENDGDVEAAMDWLRAKGIAKAGKKAGRTAADGLVAVAVSDDGKTGAVIEFNAETDFVARNEGFQEAAGSFARAALDTDGTLDALTGHAATDGGDGTVADQITRLIATIGENMSLRRVAKIEVGAGAVASYVHGAVADGLGKIGVLVALEDDGDAAKLSETGRKVAMHVAATAPASARVDDLDPELVERERQVLTDQARESGKPDNVIEKMIEGRIKKFYKEVVLLEQQFVMDPDRTVAKFIADETGGDTLKGFVRFAVGEGIEKEESDFAAEVAAATKGS